VHHTMIAESTHAPPHTTKRVYIYTADAFIYTY